MKLLIINTRRCNPVVGGIEACSYTLARGLISRGHKAYFLYTRRIPLTADFDSPAPEFVMPSDVDYVYDASCEEFYCKLLRELEIDTVLFQRAVLENRYFLLENTQGGSGALFSVTPSVPVSRAVFCSVSQH